MARLVILGGTGFIGRHTVATAVAAGHTVQAVSRSTKGAAVVAAVGAHPILGSAQNAADWICEAAGADLLVDLAQPALPARLTSRAAARVAAERVEMSKSICAALASLPARRRPALLTASGADDLQPGPDGSLTDDSRPRAHPRGFGRIGIPVRRAVEEAAERHHLRAAFIYFGNVVYGPGKAFTDTIAAGLQTGRTKVIGDGGNRLPLTSVTDAAAAITHLATLGREQRPGQTFLAVPSTPVTQRTFLDTTADALGVPRPGAVPVVAAAFVAGRVNAELMTLDAVAEPRVLPSLGFRFTHGDLTDGIAAAVADAPPWPARIP